MEYRSEANSGNYAVVITFLFGALGITYGAAQIIPAAAISTGDAILQVFLASAVWGIAGLILGATISTILSARFWSIPIVLALAFLVYHFNMIRH